jgi:hypothetical protein
MLTGGTKMIKALVAIVMAIGAPDPGPVPIFESALHRLGVRSALVLASQAVDEQPVWSPDGRFLAVNVDEKWGKIGLDSVTLRAGVWHVRDSIAVADPKPAVLEISEADVRSWEKNAKFDPRRITTKTGTVVELDSEGVSTIFRITKRNGKPSVQWKTSLENCHSLALSPDETLVAYICELNGVIVTALEQ